MSYEGPVRLSAELQRILALPRRVLDFTSPEVANLAWAWSRQLLNENGLREFDRIAALPQAERDEEFARHARPKALGGMNCPLLMSGEQAIMLWEAFHCGGLFASATVGAGKTLVSFLLSLIVGAAVPVIVVPSGLEDDTHEKFADYSKFWKAPRPTPTVVAFEVISNPNNALILCDCAKCAGTKDEPAKPGGLRPTHIFVDECDKLRNPEAAVTRRIGRYMAKHYDTTNYYGMTATPWRKSIKNSAPQIIWALKWGAPVPIGYVDTQEWSEVLDMSTRGVRRDPGALTLLSGRDPKTVETFVERERLAAEGFQKRLLETPGIIQTYKQSCDTPLTIRMLKAPDDPILDAAFAQFRTTQATLDGWDIDDPLSALRYGTEMGAGFYYFWSPRPPLEWLEARRAASKRVREIIAESRHGRPLDTKAQVYRLYPNDPTLVAWLEIEPTFVPNTVARPISASVLGFAANWIRENTPALVWVRHDYVGAALSAMSGVPYFSSKGKDSSGRYIGKHSPKLSAILSLSSNMRGRNLQAWNKNLALSPPQANTEWEQGIFGRTHRQGQERPVHTDVLISCAENLHAVTSAYAEAEWVRSRGGAVGKLLIAEYDWSNYPAAQLDNLTEDHPSRHRWARA